MSDVNTSANGKETRPFFRCQEKTLPVNDTVASYDGRPPPVPEDASPAICFAHVVTACTFTQIRP